MRPRLPPRGLLANDVAVLHAKRADPASVRRLMDGLPRRGLRPDGASYQRLVWAHCAAADLAGAEAALLEMRAARFSPDKQCYHSLARALGRGGSPEGDAAVARRVCADMQADSVKPDVWLGCMFVRTLVQGGDRASADKVVAYMRDRHVEPDQRVLAELAGRPPRKVASARAAPARRASCSPHARARAAPTDSARGDP
ncbi:unnamed protein product [Prorocentrum cordatum]|uniref:Pentacotripeptide-repeat region of PRORP domain-containing protein n=1 Tax=Prorocentrum cordatum TaxID=2364126 RepID=A0ABN9RYN9_9DINO|nr:unnamed protein product [Polarella glacialis]